MILDDKQMIELLIENFGTERLIAALPQRQVTKLLDLVSVRELADGINLNYHTLRSHMNDDTIPFPTVRLVRRAYYTRDQADKIKEQWMKRN